MKKLALLALLALPLSAQPRIVNGTLTTVRASGDLRAQIVGLGDGWNGYSVPTDHKHLSTCGGWGDDSITINADDRDDLRIAGGTTLSIFFRVAAGRIEGVRTYSADCALDANGAAVRWIEGVAPASSERLLRSIVEASPTRDRIAKKALTALALQTGTTETLIDLARHHSASEIRGQALFWLGQRAGDRAAAALRDAVNNDPEERIREKAVFGISQLPDDQSVPLLIELMKTNRSPGVRRKAAFWLGQKKDPRALEALADILR